MSTSQKTLLVTGGAGYIGSHTVHLLVKGGANIVVLDNLVYGHRDAVPPGVELAAGDLGDAKLVHSLFEKHRFDAVLHFAAYAYVGESVEKPDKYYDNNAAKPLTLLNAMVKYGCKKFIFSSTCATYGNPQRVPMDENHPQLPINPYGQSKLMLEKILSDYGKAFGIQSVFLRYFNACGALESGEIGEDHTPETHLIPLVLMACDGRIPKVTVFGTDYETPDGTCIRDYIHVADLAAAHVSALDYLNRGGETVACNLGTGHGVSVKEIIAKAEKVSGKKVPVEYGKRRAGDPPKLVADPSLAKKVLGWEAKYRDVTASLETAWKWMKGPRGGRYSA